MSRAARSLLVYGIYVIVLGVILVIAPNPFLFIFRMEEATDVWISVVGMVLVFLGCYYMLAARSELKPFFQWSIPLRLSVVLFFTGFILFGNMQNRAMGFAVVEILAALWTWIALRADRRADM